jgi:hypothetical protein
VPEVREKLNRIRHIGKIFQSDLQQLMHGPFLTMHKNPKNALAIFDNELKIRRPSLTGPV